MFFNRALTTAAGFLALSHVALAVALPQNAGNGGFSDRNVCDARGQPEITYGAQQEKPNPVSCQHLSQIIRSGSVFGDRTQIGPQGRTFSSGDCQFFAECPVFEEGTPYWVGADDVADLIDSAISDFKDAEEGKICVAVSNSKNFAVKEDNVVPCEDGSGRLINVKYEVRKFVSGGTLNN